jgi:uncharacterized protein (TIGR01777 family)
MPEKIVIAGGTGFVGEYLTEHFRALGKEVFIISRRAPHIKWTDQEAIQNALENASMIINLAGKSVNCRYTEKNKKEILLSRTATTKILGEIILKCKKPPALWINSSTATIYRHAEDKPMTESAGEIGSGFSVSIAKGWEKIFFDFQLPQTRKIALRMAIVLGEKGGVMIPFQHMVRYGLGGKQGNGKQMFSWIHINDLFRIILFLQSHDELNGVFNCSSPNPVNNKTLMNFLRQSMHVNFGIPAPTWLLKVGAAMIGTETELILKSRWVIPERLTETGFEFKFPKLDEALNEIMKQKK